MRHHGSLACWLSPADASANDTFGDRRAIFLGDRDATDSSVTAVDSLGDRK